MQFDCLYKKVLPLSKCFGFLIFSGGIEMKHWEQIDYNLQLEPIQDHWLSVGFFSKFKGP